MRLACKASGIQQAFMDHAACSAAGVAVLAGLAALSVQAPIYHIHSPRCAPCRSGWTLREGGALSRVAMIILVFQAFVSLLVLTGPPTCRSMPHPFFQGTQLYGYKRGML